MSAPELALAAAVLPLLLVAILGLALFVRRPLSEPATGILVAACFLGALAGFVAAAVRMAGIPRREVPLGEWFGIAGHHFEFRLLLDRLSLAFAAYAALLCGLVGVFAHRYLHREPGYARFFFLLALFAVGILMIVLAGDMELIFAGWEIVGLSSALLVAFFHDRPLPVQNGLRVFVVYRVCDIGLLAAYILVHHELGTGRLTGLFAAPITAGTLVSFLVLLAVAGKSAQIPFSGWLPRAMEGPTPSSAIFYGALSVQAGAFVLLRLSPLFERAPAARAAIVALGLVTAAHAALVGRVQTDAKCALSYASMTQVGLILAEIGLGWNTLALVHLLGHGSVRSLQFLRSPSLLLERHHAENRVGGLPAPREPFRFLPAGARRWLYRFALERAYLDAALERFVVAPFLGAIRRLDGLERAWSARWGGRR
ncbi:MAG: proton-conducting transporter membrane subunit [Planctomycetota bacterium]